MKIEFTQSGGFGGLTRGVELDSSSMDPREASELKTLLDAAGVSDTQPGHKIGAALSSNAAFPDGQVYELRIIDTSGTRQVVINDSSTTEQVGPLIQFLKKRSKPRRPT